MKKLRIFLSSVQKELEIERVAVAGWVSADPQLSEHCEVVLYDKQPLTGKRVSKPYLKCMETCRIYLLILDCEYGNPPEFSATHEEYRFARDNGMPMLVFIKGTKDDKRADKTKEFLAEIKKDENTYRRFHDRVDLKPEVENALGNVLKEFFEIDLTAPENGAAGAIEPASMFEQQALDISAGELDMVEAERWLGAIKAIDPARPTTTNELLNKLREKGLVRKEEDAYQTQASGLLFLGKDPSLRFPQCRVFADAFRGNVPTSTPADQKTLSSPAPVMVKTVWDFVQKNTRHPMRVVGLNRIALDEYPEEAVREAVVNAIAHRNYEDGARQILVKLFSDRLEVLSPGEPLKPLTVAKIKRGNCQPCSRNPILGQYLNHLRLMDQRGSGIGRMKTAMLNLGLDAPAYDLVDGYFRVTLKGPGDDLDQLRVPAGVGTGIPPAVEEQLTERQKQIMSYAVENGTVTTSWAVSSLGISKITAVRDLKALCDMRMLKTMGQGRNVHYVPEQMG
jgi:ATP-dependent DNA helicase RecG